MVSGETEAVWLSLYRSAVTMSCMDNIEVRDSRMGYFMPGRYGLGVWPDGTLVGASSLLPPCSAGTSYPNDPKLQKNKSLFSENGHVAKF